MAKGFIIAEIRVDDPAGYEEYRHAAARSLEEHGGRYLVRGGTAELLEGEAEPQRLVVLEFDSPEAARAWWESQEYAGARALRRRTATTRMILVEGT